MARDILKTLKAEHAALKALFEAREDTTDRAKKTRAEILASIEAALLPHAKWEELVFYPAFKARADLDEQYEDWKASPACANELAAARARSTVKAAVKSLTG